MAQRHAGVQFVNNGPHSCTTAGVTYEYINDIGAKVGDMVICETRYGLAVAKVVKVLPYINNSSVNATCNIVAIVDLKKYTEELRRRKQLEAVEIHIHKRIRALAEDYKALAGVLYRCISDSELDVLVQEYQELGGKI